MVRVGVKKLGRAHVQWILESMPEWSAMVKDTLPPGFTPLTPGVRTPRKHELVTRDRVGTP